MKETSDIIACVVDKGLFLPIAQKLSEQYKKVYWWSPWERDFPCLKDGIIGDGFENIERIDDIWGVKSKCDLFVFPDIGFSGLQKELISQGFPVWGAREADSLEMNRGKFLRELEKLGMPVPHYEIIVGLSELRKFLKEKTDKWIKISKWRGDIETTHWRDWDSDNETLDLWSLKLGPAKEHIPFYVLDSIDTDIEDGVDTYCIRGEMPSLCMHGMESKDKGYLCTITPFQDIPENIRLVSEKFAPVLAKYDYRGFFSTEVRVSGEDSYFIDPTLRAGSPPSQVMTELFSNIGEIIWTGANGECVDPDPSAEFGGQVIIKSKTDKTLWTVSDIPEKIRRWVKVSNSCEIDGMTCTPPNENHGNDIGWLVATGDSIEKVVLNLKEYASQLPDGFVSDCFPIAELLDEIKKAESEGMEFSGKPIPGPEVVLETP